MRSGTQTILMATILALFGAGCAGTLPVSTTVDVIPLEYRYDIEYVDNTAVGIDVLVMSPVLPSIVANMERGLDRAFKRVAQKLPKSRILESQVELRDALQVTLVKETGLEEARLFLLSVEHFDRSEVAVELSMK